VSAAPDRAGGLTTVHSGLPLPGAPPAGPVAGAAAGGRLHLLGAAPRAEAWHLALDPDGRPVAPPAGTGLPAAHSLAAGPDSLLVSCTGERGGRSVPVLARLALDGRVTDRGDLPLTGTLTHWPELTTTGRTTWAAWTTAGPAGDRCWLAEWRDGTSVADLAPVELAAGDGGAVIDLAVAGGEERVLVASLLGGVGRPARIGLRVLADGQQVVTGEVPDAGDPAFLRVRAGPGGWWFLWKERAGGVLVARRLRYGTGGGWDPPLALYRTGAPERVYDAHLVPAASGEIALLVRVAAARGGDVHRFRDLVALLPADGAVDGFRQLDEPGTAWSAAGWLDGRLLLVHGTTRPLVTVLAPA
jgi:hypothetical protein